MSPYIGANAAPIAPSLGSQETLGRAIPSTFGVLPDRSQPVGRVHYRLSSSGRPATMPVDDETAVRVTRRSDAVRKQATRRTPVIFPKKEIVTRYPDNPILTADDMPVACNAVFNSGVTMFDGRTLMLLRIEDIDRFQHLRVATSDDGYRFDVGEEPVTFPEDPDAERYEGTIYDPRITRIEDRYIVCYAAHSEIGVRIGMAETRDFRAFTRLPFGSAVDNRNGVLFPEKIGGRYARLERPQTIKDQGDLWISFSPDLVHWGDAHCVARSRHHSWDQWKLGAGAVPIRTDKGWLLIYHGACKTASGAIYRLGVMLLDRDDPKRVVARSRAAVLWPKESYERVGDVPNVVFTCGAIPDPDGTVRIYYGGADTCMCVATARLDDLVTACFDR